MFTLMLMLLFYAKSMFMFTFMLSLLLLLSCRAFWIASCMHVGWSRTSEGTGWGWDRMGRQRYIWQQLPSNLDGHFGEAR